MAANNNIGATRSAQSFRFPWKAIKQDLFCVYVKLSTFSGHGFITQGPTRSNLLVYGFVFSLYCLCDNIRTTFLNNGSFGNVFVSNCPKQNFANGQNILNREFKIFSEFYKTSRFRYLRIFLSFVKQFFYFKYRESIVIVEELMLNFQ